MTFGELKAELSDLTEEQLDCDISVCIESQDEYFSGTNAEMTICEEDDVLDADHPFIYIKDIVHAGT